MQGCNYASLQSRLVRPGLITVWVSCFLRTSKKGGPYHVRFRVPEEVGPVGIRLHLTKDEEFAQAKLNYPRRNLRVTISIC
jgi:hypothetical protein